MPKGALEIHATGPRTFGECPPRIGRGSERGGVGSRVSERLPRRWPACAQASDTLMILAVCVWLLRSTAPFGTFMRLHPFGTFMRLRIVADYDEASIGVVSIYGDIVTLALKADPPCELEGGKQFGQHF